MTGWTLLRNPLATPAKRLRLAPALTSPRSGIVRLAFFRRLPDLLAELGADPDTTLASAGLARADFEDPECEIAYARFEELLVECERRTGCDYFGLLLGKKTQLADLGLLFSIARCAATVGEALHTLEWTYNLRRGGGVVHTIDTGDSACFVFAIATPDTRDTRQYQMAAVTVAFKILGALCGPDWRPSEVRFAFRSPSTSKPFLRFYRAPVQFDADDSLISFARPWLAQPLTPVDDSTRRIVAAELRAMRERAFTNFPVLVRDVIRMQLVDRRMHDRERLGRTFLASAPPRAPPRPGWRELCLAATISQVRGGRSPVARDSTIRAGNRRLSVFLLCGQFRHGIPPLEWRYPKRLSPAGALISHRAE